MLKKAISYIKRFRRMQRINMCLSRGAANISSREIRSSDPNSWEFSAFSQNGEDGIIDYLTRKLINPNRYFIEIGASNGLENNTSWLALGRKYSGLMIEGDLQQSKECEYIYPELNLGVKCICQFVDSENIETLKQASFHKNPDIFSIDIDGNDYYISKAILASGFKPKIFVVEYNAVFGPDRIATIPYDPNFIGLLAHESQLYYGVSIAAWKYFFSQNGYKFITVDLNGVNAFFVDPSEFDSSFLKNIEGLDYQDNFYQIAQYRDPWDIRFKLIEDMEISDIN